MKNVLIVKDAKHSKDGVTTQEYTEGQVCPELDDPLAERLVELGIGKLVEEPKQRSPEPKPKSRPKPKPKK